MMSELPAFSARSMAIRTAAILFVFVIIFTALLSGAYLWTRPAIEASAQAEKMRLIDEVLPRTAYDNDLITDTLNLPPLAELGSSEESVLYRARRKGQPAALVFEAVAPDGYAGKIRLVIAVNADGSLAGVRVTQHRETPGLGDYIEVRKDKNKARPWITQFVGLSLDNVNEAGWHVRKDGGRIDHYAGATVTPRSVTKAIHKALQWAVKHHIELYEAGEAK